MSGVHVGCSMIHIMMAAAPQALDTRIKTDLRPGRSGDRPAGRGSAVPVPAAAFDHRGGSARRAVRGRRDGPGRVLVLGVASYKSRRLLRALGS